MTRSALRQQYREGLLGSFYNLTNYRSFSQPKRRGLSLVFSQYGLQGGSLDILKTIMENSICEDPSSYHHSDHDHQYVSLKGCTLMHCAAQGWKKNFPSHADVAATIFTKPPKFELHKHSVNLFSGCQFLNRNIMLYVNL